MSTISKYYTLGMDELSEGVVIFKKCCNKIKTYRLINSNATEKFDKLHSDFLNTANSLLVNYNSMQFDEIESMCKTLIIINAKIQKLLLVKKYINYDKANKKIFKVIKSDLEKLDYKIPSFKSSLGIVIENHCFLTTFAFIISYFLVFTIVLFLNKDESFIIFFIGLIVFAIISMIISHKSLKYDKLIRSINGNKYFETKKVRSLSKICKNIIMFFKR